MTGPAAHTKNLDYGDNSDSLMGERDKWSAVLLTIVSHKNTNKVPKPVN